MYIYTNEITFHFHQNYCKKKLSLKNKDSKIKLQFDENLLMHYKSKNIFMKFSLGRRKKDIRKKKNRYEKHQHPFSFTRDSFVYA